MTHQSASLLPSPTTFSLTVVARRAASMSRGVPSRTKYDTSAMCTPTYTSGVEWNGME